MHKITIIEYTEKWAVGGIESYVLNIVKLIDREKFDVRIVAAQKESDFYDAELQKCGVQVESILDKPKDGPIGRVLTNMFCFERYLRRNPCDVIHLHISQGVVMRYAKTAKKLGIQRVISHCHNTDVGTGARFLKLTGHKIGKKMFNRYVDERIACSELAAQWLYTKKDIENDKVKIYKCIIDVERFKYSKEDSIYMRNKYGLENRKICLNAGRLCCQKNQLFLLDIFNEMLKLDKDYILIVIGTGELEEQIHRKLSELQIESKVIMIKHTNEMEKYMSMADLFVLPSLFEGNPITGIEAQASGLPCYFSDKITKQAKVSDSTQFIQLSCSAGLWAKTILEQQNALEFDRTLCAESLKQNGYDKCVQIKELEKTSSL